MSNKQFIDRQFIDRLEMERKMKITNINPVNNNKHIEQCRTDFDLFDIVDKKSLLKSDTLNYDDEGLTSIVESVKQITKGDSFEDFTMSVTKSTMWIHNLMSSLNEFSISGFGLYLCFGTIYLISKNMVEMDLKNYFGFQNKKQFNAGLLTLKESLTENISINGYIINDETVTTNLKTSNNLKPLVHNIVINKNNLSNELNRLNNIIYKTSGIKNCMSANTVSNIEINLICTIRLTPIWLYGIDKIVDMKFKDDVMKFIVFKNKSFNYYEDINKIYIEVPLINNIYVLGFIVSNNDKLTDLKDIIKSIGNMKKTVLNDVSIPILNKRYKIRLNKTLQKTGLNSVFVTNEPNLLFPENSSINDCLQYTEIIFGTVSDNMKSSNESYKTVKKCILNKSFEFYLRNVENNCIVLTGKI